MICAASVDASINAPTTTMATRIATVTFRFSDTFSWPVIFFVGWVRDELIDKRRSPQANTWSILWGLLEFIQ